MVTATPVRLIPRWYTAVVVVMLVVLTGVFTGLTLSVDGVMGWSAWGLVLFAGLLLLAALSALVRPRRVREPAVSADGTRVFLAPMLTVAALLGAWCAALAVAALWGFVALTDFDALESPGFALVAIVGAIGSLPDLVRLLTGRLHRWRLELGPETLRYRGYRTIETWSWSKVHGARIQARGPAGVAIDVKGAGKDPVVPITAFAVPAEQLIEEIQRAKATARR